MRGIDKKAAVIVAAAFVGTAGFLSGYYYFSDKSGKNENQSVQNDVQNNLDYIYSLKKRAEQNSLPEEDKISGSTKMVYEYYYEDDGRTEVLEEVPPYFLVDMTKDKLEDAFDEWSVKTFSSKEVVLRKNIKGKSSQHYIVGEYDGFVAVFYEEEIDGTNLKEITDTPVSTLPLEEQAMLKDGIYVEGNENLMKVIQDYES